MPEKIDVNELGRSVDPKSLSEEELVGSLRDGLAGGGAKDIDPSLFARLVKSTGKGQLEAVMSRIFRWSRSNAASGSKRIGNGPCMSPFVST